MSRTLKLTCRPGDPLLRGCLLRRDNAEELRGLYRAAAAWLALRRARLIAEREFKDPDLKKASAA